MKKLRRTQLVTLLWVLLALLVVTGATYAWFTFRPYTNVEPMSSAVSQGDVSLLISNSQDGPFDRTCTLTPSDDPDTLAPLSTGDLDSFYQAIAQNTEGISVLYQDVTDSAGSYAIHGTVYLQSLYGASDVYLNQEGLGFGADAQTQAALRLGLIITTAQGTSTYIFRLDDLGGTAGASATRTVPTGDTVVSSISGGVASYISDPAQDMESYFAQTQEDGDPQAGEQVLATLQTDEVATVEYWLYLEGCDDNCMNDVQNRDLALQLSFAGVPKGT